MTKRAVDNVLDNLLCEDEMEDYSVKSTMNEEEDSYFEGSKAEEDAKQAAMSHATELTNYEEIEESNTTLQESERKQVPTNLRDEKELPIDIAMDNGDLDDDSYFDRDMDVSSLIMEDALSTLEKDQGIAPEWAFNVRSLRHKDTSKYAKLSKEEAPNEEMTPEEETTILENANVPDEDSNTGRDVGVLTAAEQDVALTLLEDHSTSSYLPLLMSLRQQDNEENATTAGREATTDNEEQVQSFCSSSAATTSLPAALQYDDVSLSSNKSKELVMAVGSARHNSSASWWQDDHDEEAGTVTTPQPSSKKNKPTGPDEEPLTLRKTFMILFLIIGLAAITGGIATLVTSQHQKSKIIDDETVQATSPPRITPPPSPQVTKSPSAPPTATPTIQPTSATASTTVTTEQPTAHSVSAVPTSAPNNGDSASPTIDHEKLTLRERIELFSPESLPYLENVTSPQAQALAWALKQSNHSLEHYSLATLFFSATKAWINDDGWLTSASICDWYGVACRDHKVTELNLSFNNLASTLPDELSLLTDLQVLSLSGAAGTAKVKGSLIGTIPSSWGERLVNLGELHARALPVKM